MDLVLGFVGLGATIIASTVAVTWRAGVLVRGVQGEIKAVNTHISVIEVAAVRAETLAHEINSENRDCHRAIMDKLDQQNSRVRELEKQQAVSDERCEGRHPEAPKHPPMSEKG
jgi:hypothetical protein